MTDKLSPKQWQTLGVVYLMTAATIVYGQIINHNWLAIGDDTILLNPTIVDGDVSLESMRLAFARTQEPDWHPLTSAMHVLLSAAFGMNSTAFHAISIAFHLANTFLMFLLFKRATGAVTPSIIVSALFALHPLHVESVAWAFGLPQLMSTFFLLLALMAYDTYARAPSPLRYGAVVLAFAMMLLSSALSFVAVVTFVLWDIWPLRRRTAESRSAYATGKRIVFEKLPLFVMAGSAFLMSSVGRAAPAFLRNPDPGVIWDRFANANVAGIDAFLKVLWPWGLAMHYPYRGDDYPAVKVFFALAVLSFASVLVATQFRKRPYLVVGWFWYVVTSVPGIAVLRLGTFAIGDSYLYIPLIGLAIAGAWGMNEFVESRPVYKRVAYPVAIVLMLSLMTLSYAQAKTWRQGWDLYRYNISVYPDSALAQETLAKMYYARNSSEQALEHMFLAVEAEPNNTDLRASLIVMLAGANMQALAREQYRILRNQDPNHQLVQALLAESRSHPQEDPGVVEVEYPRTPQ